jgi:hypothetical protein
MSRSKPHSPIFCVVRLPPSCLMADAGQLSSLLHQLATVQHRRATLPDATAAEVRALAAREGAAAARRAQATEASRARVEALLSGVPAPLLALAGARASLQLTADQRLALEVHLLAAEEAELQRATAALEAEAAALEARERAALASLEALPSELQRLQQQAADVRVRDGRGRVCVRARAHELVRAHLCRPHSPPLSHSPTPTPLLPCTLSPPLPQ